MRLAVGSNRIINCVNNVNISAAGSGIGGVLGKCYGTLEMINCVNTGLISDISKSESVAGIIGRNEAKAKVFNSYNLGDIISPGLQVGGIIGYGVVETIIINVYNAGNITVNGSRGRGGIIGSFGGDVTIGTIKNAYNVGTIVDKKVNWTYGAGSMCGYFYNDNTQLTIENGYY